MRNELDVLLRHPPLTSQYASSAQTAGNPLANTDTSDIVRPIIELSVNPPHVAEDLPEDGIPSLVSLDLNDNVFVVGTTTKEVYPPNRGLVLTPKKREALFDVVELFCVSSFNSPFTPQTSKRLLLLL